MSGLAEKNKRPLPLGIDNFEEIIRRNYCYIDKTGWIAELLRNQTEVTLVTRPRRFGKTLNMSMLESFFNIEKKAANQNLFQGLTIEKSPYYQEQGQYPVVFISMKDLKSNTYADMEIAVQRHIASLYTKYYAVVRERLWPQEESMYQAVMAMNMPLAVLGDALRFLLEALYRHYQKKVVLLLDEYDSPIIGAYAEGYYKEAIGFFRNFYGAALKGNEYLKMAVLTGILRVVKESIFSGLNNLEVASILQPLYLDKFGFTPEEVEQLKAEYQSPAEKGFNASGQPEQGTISAAGLKEWYDGYYFGNSVSGCELYNPWSILSCLKYQKLQAYWVNTGSDVLIEKTLRNDVASAVEYLEELLAGRTVTVGVDENITLQALDERRTMNDLWGLLLFAGYLTVEEEVDLDLYRLRIPNLEIKKYFQKTLARAYEMQGSTTNLIGLLKEKREAFVRELRLIFLNSASYYDFTNENSYHMFLLGILTALANPRFQPVSNREAGKGRLDILAGDEKKAQGYVFELKLAKSSEEMENAAEEALRQIRRQKYAAPLLAEGYQKVTGVGLGFYGKELAVCFEDWPG